MDIHSPATTVHEALYFSARCRLMGVNKAQLSQFVDQVLSLLLAMMTDMNSVLYRCLMHSNLESRAFHGFKIASGNPLGNSQGRVL